VLALISMPNILRDTQKDCGKPGCLNDYRVQVLARGDEMIEQERRLPPLADTVAKVFLRQGTEILRAVGAMIE
jgi:hypothetical protein